MEQATLRRLYNACDPAEPLAPDDPRNVDVDTQDFGLPRGVVWAEDIARELMMSDKPLYRLFTGLPGSGKSTELRRLQWYLSERARFLSVLIDADNRLDLTSPVDVPDIVTIVVYELERAVLDAEGKDPEAAFKDSFFVRVGHWLGELGTSDLKLSKLDVGINGSKLVFEMQSNPGFRRRVRQALGVRLADFLAEARSHVQQLSERIRQAGWEDVVVIFDSLEKLRGMSTNWEEVINSAEQVFGGPSPHVNLNVHTIYTVPSALLARQTQIEFMPVVKIRERDGRPSESGMHALRTLVHRRFSGEERLAIFGPEPQQSQRIDRIIWQSGGYFRALVRMLRWCVVRAKLPLNDSDIEQLFAKETDAFRRVISSEDFEWLAQVAREKYLTLANEARRPFTDRILANSVVLRYQNRHDWWELHPAVEEIPGIREAIRRGGSD